MFNFSTRQLVKICAFALFVFIFQLLSPWKIVIEIRRATDPISSSDGSAAAVIPTQDSSRAEPQEENRKKDYIEKNFGSLEEEFIKSIREPSSPPKRSRDDSIKLIYDTKSANDWLDLIEDHDIHVCPLLL